MKKAVSFSRDFFAAFLGAGAVYGSDRVGATVEYERNPHIVRDPEERYHIDFDLDDWSFSFMYGAKAPEAESKKKFFDRTEP